MNIEKNTIYNMECIQGMKCIPDKSIDMILCDLPYGTTNCRWDEIIPFDVLWEQYKRIIKDHGAIVLTASQPFTSKLIASNMSWFRYEWIWKKGKHTTGFQNAKKMPLKNHENICVFYKKLPTYHPQGIVPLLKVRKSRRKRVGGIFKEDDTSLMKEYTTTHTNYPKSILDFARDSKTFHPTQKPFTLFEYLIKTYTNKGDVVLDNCMGSFTTAVACDNTQRNWIGFELENEYCEYGIERINKNREVLRMKELQGIRSC
ncbi:site-specific DNA-methyltransferase (adenine-specific) [Gracilibacillus orientalis]|uniref:Methyltransferase n=1 Tax=Gracilibacillus orientalis TaxID=334253 RepID=A0A1I4HAE3_9BACI|nr:site-specific DNA-methyltransferase [Gracilibacillus orientalis]SFL39252.1 site-specific DNA-methyltransferase (adenine-specific) [Gracilibacillus orientalis]